MFEHSKAEIELDTPYRAVAVYYDASDTVEYVRHDVTCTYQRIDGFLTLAFDMSNNELVGFRLKGFKHVYLTYTKPTLDRLGVDFIAVVSVIERVVEKLGKDIFEPERKEAYRQAHEVARADAVQVDRRELPAAA